MADTYEAVDPSTIRHLQCKDHKKPITCLAISQDCQLLFSASKDCTIVKWSLSDWKRLGVIKRVDKKNPNGAKGHKSVIQSLSISSDGKFLASGDMDNMIHIWDPATLSYLHTFKGKKTNMFMLKALNFCLQATEMAYLA